MTSGDSFGKRFKAFIIDNIVTIIFIVFVSIGLYVSNDLSFEFLVNELVARFFRNGFLVLSLIIPVIAGLGLNFGIVIGALAGMLSLIVVRYFALGGISGLMLSFLIALPLALLFGFATGKLYNKTRGQEMIASLIVGYFASGIYQFIVLFVLGVIIPLKSGHVMVKPDGVGLRATFDMGPHPASRTFNPETQTPGLRYALDWIWQAPFPPVLVALALCFLIYLVVRRMLAKRNPALGQTKKWSFIMSCAICGALILLGLHAIFLPNGIRFLVVSDFFRSIGFYGIQIPASPLTGVREIPAVTGVAILAICLFTHYFTKTKLGQDCRSIGQSQHIAKVSGINVDRTRVIATMISTVLAAWGMIIYLQNMGTVSTYTSHMQIGMFSVAALLVGGASTTKASIKNAMLGLVLFNAMFIVSPAIGRIFSGDEGVGEYTRSFMVYGVIGLALGLYVWKSAKAGKDKDALDDIAFDPQPEETREKPL